MQARAFLLLAAIALAACGWSEGRAAACNVEGDWNFPRKANLPRGAEVALGFAMAERGAPWNPTDVHDSRRRLPSARFVSARQRDCALTIDYEQGGIAHNRATATLAYDGRGWRLIRPR